jgi:hypothetical protein
MTDKQTQGRPVTTLLYTYACIYTRTYIYIFICVFLCVLLCMRVRVRTYRAFTGGTAGRGACPFQIKAQDKTDGRTDGPQSCFGAERTCTPAHIKVKSLPPAETRPLSVTRGLKRGSVGVGTCKGGIALLTEAPAAADCHEPSSTSRTAWTASSPLTISAPRLPASRSDSVAR